MGLLTNPNNSQSMISYWYLMIIKNYTKIVWPLYFVGIAFYFVLPGQWYSARTYFSENALLPGLVTAGYYSEQNEAAKSFLADLKSEADAYPSSIPFPWLEARLRQLGLEVYTHNYTLNFPLGKADSFTGQNIYAILRAPRASSTESLVLSVPYRPPYSVEQKTDVSIALLLSLAKFFRQRNYWAKDIIFLITQHEQLGAQAWLEAYHQTTSGSGILDHGDLDGRAGSIQAAINLEIGTEKISHLNVRIEGLNGQLPNLDLVNLVYRLCMREQVPHLFQGKQDRQRPDPWFDMRALQTLTSMVLKQATGVPSGNHGLFHRFGIEAVTIEGVTKGRYVNVNMETMGRVVEGIFRSLNNLLERFHQSFFFYLLPSTTHYVSIGMYMPMFGFLGGCFVIVVLGLWYEAVGSDEPNDQNPLPSVVPPKLFSVFPAVVLSHFLGFAVTYLPRLASVLADQFDTDEAIMLFIASFCVASLFITKLFKGIIISDDNWKCLKCIALMEMAALAFCMSLCNFSLALICTVIYVPVSLLVQPSKSYLGVALRMILTVLAHPLTLIFIFCAFDTFAHHFDKDAIATVYKSAEVTKRALMYSITDSYIFGNVNFNVGALCLLPCWNMLWFLNFKRS